MNLFRRGQSKETVDATLLKMAKHMPPASLIIADSYFGGGKSLDQLTRHGYHALLACSRNRPSWLFSRHLCSSLEDGGVAVAYGQANNFPFHATASRVEKVRLGIRLHFFLFQVLTLFHFSCFSQSYVCTISTVFSTKTSTVVVEQLQNDDSPECQQRWTEARQCRTESRAQYSSLMDLVDGADREILSVFMRNKKGHWTSAVLLWLVLVIVQVNSRRVFSSATGSDVSSTPLWTEQCLDALAERDIPWTVAHERKRIPPKKTPVCRACFHIPPKRRRQTLFACDICGPICKHCEKNGNHNAFFRDHLSTGSVSPQMK